MPTEIILFDDPGFDTEITEIHLSDVQMKWADSVGQGEPVRFFGRNEGSSTLRDCSVSLKGDGAESVRLAIDTEEGQGTWAAPGEPVLVRQYLGPREEFAFWAQALFTQESRAGRYPFEVIFSGVEIG